MRKTNLFYLEDNTSNFLTFSNYGEFLTGVCLSTNHKIWPSAFLCLNLPFTEYNYNNYVGSFDNINNYNLDGFKHFLMCYYENKLAWLRDEYEKQDKRQELLNNNNNLLNYLLEAIYHYFSNTIDNIDYNIIPYFGDIVEHDYNGSYNDSICIVDFNRIKQFDININLNKYKQVNYSEELLHNWELNELINTQNINYNAIYDNDTSYTYDDNFIEFKYTDESYDFRNYKNNLEQISFNCIIPLFDIINSNPDENQDNINEDIESTYNYKYIPYGIWFASENKNGTLNNIVLNKKNDNIAQTWSLVICSKFSPYPMGIKINENDTENIERVIEKYTYAELLSKQSELLNNYNELSINFNKLLSKINIIEQKINNMEQLYPENGYQVIDRVETKIRDNKTYVDNEISILKNDFNNLLEQFKWIAVQQAQQ